LIALHELTSDGEQWFFTMELVDGVSFDEYVGARTGVQRRSVDRDGHATMVGRARLLRDSSVTLSQPGIAGHTLPRLTCDLTRLRAALAQLVSAIATLHEAGKLHRDIKPSNVMVTAEGRVVVLDFGLVASSTLIDAEAQDPDRTIGGTVFGTPAYMSPEQAVGEAITTASDWYSVGCILYEALAGRLPFEGTVLQILKQKEELEPPAPSEVVSGIPEDLDQLCVGLLRRTPEDRPTGAEIRRAFSGSSLPAQLRESIPDNHSDLFVGREPHMAMLTSAFERTKAGATSVAFVHGYSGMGKSALVRCFANELIRNGEAVVLRGRCYERESVPYKAFDDIIDSLGRYMMRLPHEEASELLPRNVTSLARLFPVLKRVRAVAHARMPLHPTTDPLEMRQQAFGALKDLLLRLSDWQPLVINIDDLQWADMDSARLLSYLLGPPDPPPVLFVGVYRREEAATSAFVRHTLADPGLNTPLTSHIAVDALATDEAVTLAAQLLHDQPYADAAFVRRLADESEGVPFFIGELTRHLRAQAQVGGVALPAVSLQDVIRARLASISRPALQLLQVLSVAARPVEQGVALDAAELSAGERAIFQELRAARMVRTRGTRQTDFVETYHDRVRETVMSDLPRARIREVHARLAQASERWGVGDPEQLVLHYSEAGEGGRAGETAIHAAAAAEDKLAFDRAADLYRRALELLPMQDQARRQQLLIRLGDALAHAGRGAQSAEAYLNAARGSGDDDAAHALRRRAARQLLASGRFEAGVALTAELLGRVGCDYPDTTTKRALAYAWTRSRITMRGLHYARGPSPQTAAVAARLQTLSLFREMQACDLLGSAWLQGRFLLAALDAGDEEAILEGLTWECFHLSMQSGARHQRRAFEAMNAAEQLSRALGTPYARAQYSTALTMLNLFARGRYRDAFEAACEGEALLRAHCPGHNWELTLLHSLKYICLEFTGDLSTLLRGAPQHARDAAERDDRFSLGLSLQSMPLVHLMQADPAGARAFIEAQADKLGEAFSTPHFLRMVRMADVLLYEGKGTEALALVQDTWKTLSRTLLFRSRVTRASAHLARGRAALMACQERHDPELHALVARDAAALKRLGAGFAGFGPAFEGQLALLAGDKTAARRLLELAQSQFSNEQSDHAVRYMQYRLGGLIGGATGAAMQSDVREQLERQAVVDVERFIRCLVPIGP
jgi:hypothetical protein